MTARVLTTFLAFAGIVVFAFSYLGSLGVQVEREPHRTNLSMDVADINGLVVGANVLLRGAPIGKITSVATTVAGATIDFYIDDQLSGSGRHDVRLENLSALGESYIGLVPRRAGGPMFPDGQHITAAAVTAPAVHSELATSVVRVLGQLDPEALQRIIGELDTALPDPVAVLPNLQRASILVRNTVANLDGKGRELLDNFQVLLQNAEFVGPALADILTPARRAGEHLNSIFGMFINGGQLGWNFASRDFVTLFRRLESFLDHRSGDIKVLSETVLPYINDISGALMNLDTSQLLDNILATLPEDGVVTLHVSVSKP